MEAEDFETPSPKRKRTESPLFDRPSEDQRGVVNLEASQPHSTAAKESASEKKSATASDDNDMLDLLMQHVEAESQPSSRVVPPAVDKTETPSTRDPTVANLTLNDPLPQDVSPDPSQTQTPDQRLYGSVQPVHDLTQPSLEAQELTQAHAQDQDTFLEKDPQPTEQLPETGKKVGNGAVENEESTAHAEAAMVEAAAHVEGIPATELQEPERDGEGAEWEVDSSPYESSSDSSDDSSSDDSDDDDDADGDYAMLDPEEQARILMQGDGGSDDEGDRSKGKGEGSGLKTANEQLDDVPIIPDVTVSDDMAVEELGVVEAIVENNVLIRAKVSGEYQVLESGSLLCHKDRKVAGVVAETLGRVEQPLYTMRFGSEQNIKDRGLVKGTTVFYVQSHSSFVFTQPLKAVKGSDASNIHDEEIGADDMEFSDDEAEAEHKRQLKLKKQGRLGVDARGRGSSRARGGHRGGRGGHGSSSEPNGTAYGNGSMEMNYDDVEEGEEGYTPLTRPMNLHEITVSNQGASGSVNFMPPPPAPSFVDRGRGRGQGRGGRDRGRGGRGGSFRGRGGGGFGSNQQHFNNTPNSTKDNNFQHGRPQSLFVPGFPSSFPPPAPMLNPQYQNLVTSPISPLPQQQFNFGGGALPQLPQSFNNNYHQQYQQQQSYSPTQQYQNQNQTPAPYFNPAIMQQFLQQQQQQQQQHQTGGGGGGGGNSHPPGWQPNSAAVAEVQRQLEEMRQAAARHGHGHGQ